MCDITTCAAAKTYATAVGRYPQPALTSWRQQPRARRPTPPPPQPKCDRRDPAGEMAKNSTAVGDSTVATQPIGCHGNDHGSSLRVLHP